MFRNYWVAALFATMEGYEKLELMNADVELLRSDAGYSRLRAFRAGIYHFREKYFDEQYTISSNSQMPPIGW
jgi:hypothetical protein